jgi:hypothetical protein
MGAVVRLADYRRRRSRVYFTRAELSQLLSLYSRRVADGIWKDYAIDHAIGVAAFSAFRHSYDRPACVIAKFAGPRGATYAGFDSRGRVADGPLLADVLQAVDRHLTVVKE